MSIRTTIEVSGARQNNLKNVSVEIPRDQLTVITGVSGSGKSSLAFDVIYGEGQRRFLDSISNFAKGRISQLKKAKVDSVRGLSPVIAIEQKKGNHNPRSTVGTVTDANDYLRLLFATAGTGHCPECSKLLCQLSAAQIAEHISSLPKGTVVELRAPVYKIYGEDYSYTFQQLRDKGFKHLLVDGVPLSLAEGWEPDESRVYRIEMIIDRFTLKDETYIQLTKSIESAMLSLDEDIMVKVEIIGGAGESITQGFYEHFGCPEHHFFLCDMQPFHFSFNTPASACHTCLGVGMSFVVEPRFLVVAPEKSINKGALKSTVFNPAGKDSYRTVLMYSLSVKYGFSLDAPFHELPSSIHDLLFYGTKGELVPMLQPPFSAKKNWMTGRDRPFGGFVQEMESWYKHYIRKSSTSEAFEPAFIKDCMIEKVCPECSGARLKRQRLQITVGNKNIDQLSRMQLHELLGFLNSLSFGPNVGEVADTIVRELQTRISLLIEIGLHYISLGRRSDSISGGEMQRIKMSTQISSELMGMLYIMDEPSIGLHPRDSHRVIGTMKKLRDLGNTVIVVEHDMDTIRSADHVIEIGPGPGIHGGNVVACGSVDNMMGQPESVTGRYLSGKAFIPVPAQRRKLGDGFLSIQGARENNLKNVDLDIPLGVLICVTGVSGSGKSSLIHGILAKQLRIDKTSARIVAGEHDFLFGADQLNHLINIDQTAIGRNSKSNPATYIGIYDKIRDLYAMQPEADARGYQPVDFSLTHANGTRCEYCAGDGILVTNLQFMADIETLCPVCKGRRFSEEGLDIKICGKSIADVLDMTVEEAAGFFQEHKYLKHKLATMNELGLGYMTLGQSSTTLSGGEAQRVKLAYELAKIKKGAHNLYILDEPTTGLHLEDIKKLLVALNKLVDSGHSVLVIEHHLDVIKSADYIIDMGPEGGDQGGYVVAEGTPEQVAEVEASYTGRYLRSELGLAAPQRT
ncbi:excinuclease ABC subunit UvrA [Paenibacillus sp. MMS20-IR301]|uniref:excinuclease ABC subunit UvrA n=1 Tax=Paenibacillus sp. MMS20-IR301 TaxID=2895946 RepID=UPI0028E78FF9|nr:excinuclease ABC subunit UvrA [Paenibacillus sp. MMS20-IR301]WNS46295.1 excinuclease ABC subunit UvrA [Paenibacillus sp. MMS20-IR301]